MFRKKIAAVTLFFAVLCLQCSEVFAQPGNTVSQADLDAIFTARWNSAAPGGAILAVWGDSVLYQQAFGLAEMEHAVLNADTTIFEAGSVSKQFTTAAILLLAKDGKLTLDDDVRLHIPELPEYDAPITIRHLFYHISGLKDWGTIGSLAGWERTTRVYTQELAMHIITRQKSTNFPVGTAYNYSNTNYTLLVEIVNRVSGMPLAEFTRQRIFEPLGMHHTSWRDDFRRIVPGRATAYRPVANGFEQLMPFEDVHGHGGLLTTVHDLHIWNRVLTDTRFFGDELSRERIERGVLNNGSTVDYAAGLAIEEHFGTTEISHSGATAGYRAWLSYYPAFDLSVAVLSNDGGFSPVPAGRALVAALLGQELPVNAANPPSAPVNYTPDADVMNQYTGTYYSDEAEARFVVVLEDGTLFIDRKPGDRFELIPTGTDQFRTRSQGTYLFIRDTDNQITGFEVTLGRAARVPFLKQ